jgi:iron complex outermembrane receptor protein
MPTQWWSRRVVTATTVWCAFAAPPVITFASATDQATDALQEIVVTATRREESISKVPISITALTQEAMDAKGIKDFQDVARFTPGVQIDANQTNQISIRGISSSGGAGTTGIYIDDTPIQMRALGFNPDEALPKTFDLDRVEVLRGPQGTLFGAGAEGGAVRYITPQPNLHESSAYARTELAFTQGGAPSYEAGYAAGVPIIDGTLGVRASVWYRRDGGWIDRIDPTTLATVDRNANYDDTVAAKLAVSWAPTDSVTITPSIYFQNRERNNLSIYWPIYSDPGADRFKSANPTGLQEPDQFILPVVKVNIELGSMELISNTSAYHRRDLSGYDGTLLNLSYYQTFGGANAYPYLPYTNPNQYPLLDQNGIHLPAGLQNYRAPAQVTNKQDNITQEIRLQSKDGSARVTWTVGAFWMISRSYSLEAISDPMANQFFGAMFGTDICTAFQVAQPDCLPNGNSYENQLIGDDRQVAVFGEANWSVTDKLKLTTGARYSRTQFSFSSFSDGAQNGGPAYGSGEEKANPFTPKLGLIYQMDPGTLTYLTWAKGFRIGGANAPVDPLLCQSDFQAFGITATPLSYAPDTVKSWELGMKNNINNRVKLATSAFYITWNGIQQTITLPTCGLSYTANAGTAVAKGFDFQADVALTDRLVLESAIGYTSARYTANSTPAPGSPVILAAKGDAIVGEAAIPNAPWTVALGLQYGFDLGAHASYARIDYEYESRNAWQTPSEDPLTAQYSYTQQPGGLPIPTNYNPSSQTFVSLRAGSQFGKWNIAAFVDNVLDTHTTTNYNFTGLDPSNSALLPLYRNFTYRPRTIGVTGTYRY